MNQTSAPSWSQIAHHDPMVSAPEDDFASFLEFGDLQLNYGNFELNPSDGHGDPQDGTGAVDTRMVDGGGMSGMKGGPLLRQAEAGHADIQQTSTLTSMAEEMDGTVEPLMDFNIQAELFRQQQQQLQTQHFHPQAIIPPTPNSMKMHGGTEHYYSQMDPQAQAIYERYARLKDDQMVFTPLVSPAVTPLDTQFRLPGDFTMPGEYFSPLTSPALEAQNAAARRSVYGAARHSDTSVGNSPIDRNMDLITSASLPTVTPLRKSRRKPPAAQFRNPTRTVRQSPAMKPQARRRSTVIPAKEVAEIIHDAQSSKNNASKNFQHGGLYIQDSSEAESISPEPLSEALMPPPATPRSASAGKSPYLAAQQHGSQSAPLLPMTNEPATPASLMKLRKQAGRPSGREDMANGGSETVENMTLPAAATSTRPFLPPINTAQANDDQTTPRLSARKTPKMAPTSATLPSACSSVMPSPLLSAMASPTSSVASRRLDSKPTGRPSKKRNSTSSVHVSPALRPKISPNIKPLLPDGVREKATVNAETSALLLASKSNYQNILEGTHLPGVSYPEALSTNLTSKRTSHKIAEQGRRNRINNALHEIASLLPATATAQNNNSGREGSGSGSGGDGNGGANGNGHGSGGHGMSTGSAAQQSNSKASTVEMAIDYIKALKRELEDTKGRLEVAEKRLEGKEGVGS